MDCLEVISVRLAREQDFDAALQLCAVVSGPAEAGRFMGIRTYRSDGYGSDLVVHIRWSRGSSGHMKSLLGMQLARGLGGFGIVSHTLLTETGMVPGGELSEEKKA